jgi:Transposase DDE domain group 1
LGARLRTAEQEASAGTVEGLKGLVAQLRQAWPEVGVRVRGDSAFAREEIMAWGEANQVDYLLGLARNARWERELAEALAQARHPYEQTQHAARVCKEFHYQTLESWSRARRVVGKAAHVEKGPNPRFVVTSLPRTACEAQPRYEQEYCARGEMENRLKEPKQDLRADKTSTQKLQSNQLRLWFASIAYVLLNELRRLGLAETELAHAQCQTLRVKLFKIGAQITVTARRVVVSLTSACPYQEIFAHIYRTLRRVQGLRC